ncbi:Zn-ribbon protein [Prochlorococcus sp. SS52]|uniref:Zn-ribbon protein n=1 Tax=Prochlorococcus marinus (strain SARG / CCMP1375 / SS120) TaxID=167539 RepID=Q7VC55_PROMA|nr:Zn-ribbon protein [Prochlorococcus marinus subsp. marinus str. CCMP1375]KGG18865.1 Zn-ribbon protein [Prochlorococcus marinus str. SS2]KGG23597.1 Zn-ribbon protein [Prochlorococcus marinus str. SS35]KGG32167.1 Zn-ribbon protein [Prochlorococcus marinus str. SS51]KGG35142.1 Zn-ribbon protein [Prochlorococcus sp. SS52]
MGEKICLRCGSRKLIADRSLGGRIVCSACGATAFKSQNFSINLLSKKGSNRILWSCLAILVLIIIIT